jgi:hypothetical protein
MTIIQIDNRFITPLKCGSRYLRSFGWETKGITMLSDGWNKFKDLNWEILVMRDPEEHLYSALHTEILSLWNNHTNWQNITEEELINLFISKTGSTHWCGILNKTIFDVYVSKNKEPKVLKLENLSLFLSLEGFPQTYIKETYSFREFDKWESSDYIKEYVKTTYPTQFDTMLDMVNEDRKYYNMFSFLNFEKKLI